VPTKSFAIGIVVKNGDLGAALTKLYFEPTSSRVSENALSQMYLIVFIVDLHANKKEPIPYLGFIKF